MVRDRQTDQPTDRQTLLPIELLSQLKKLIIRFIFILLFMVATTALSQKFFDLYPRIPERQELFPGLGDIVTHMENTVFDII